MKVLNPLQINDWNIKKFITVILSIQLIVWGLSVLNVIGINIYFISQIILFVYLTFIPGYLMLRILKLHNLGNIKTVIFAIGISLSFIMIIGFLINLLPFHTISLNILIPIFSFFTILLSIMSYIRDFDFNKPSFIEFNELFGNAPLFFILLILISIISTTIFNVNGNNTLKMILLTLIAIIPILVMLNFIPEKYYPFAVFSISLTLLLHTSLISNYIWGMDINYELFTSNLVIKNSNWDMSIFSNVNSVMSITILAPIYSLILNLNLIWIFKIVYPFIFAFVPLGLYYAFQKMLNSKPAFLSIYFFVSFFVFYSVMPALGRQEISEFFIMAIIILLVDNNQQSFSLSLLSILFGFGITISHYGTGYVFILIILFALLLRKLLNYFNKLNINKKFVIINNYFPIILIIFTIIWFMYTSSSSNLTNGVSIINMIVRSLDDLFNPATSQAISIASVNLPFFQSIERYINLISQLFIFIGVLLIALKLPTTNYNKEFYLLSIAAFTIDIFALVLPYFASLLNSDRLYHITLFFLSPILILGIVSTYEYLLKIFNITLKFNINKCFLLISIFLMIYMLFNSAFIYQLFDQSKLGRFALDNSMDWAYVNNYELTSMIWLKNNLDSNVLIYADYYKTNLLYGLLDNKDNVTYLYKFNLNNLNKGYYYVGSYYTRTQELLVLNNRSFIYMPGNFDNNILKIYDNTNSWVYIKQ